MRLAVTLSVLVVLAGCSQPENLTPADSTEGDTSSAGQTPSQLLGAPRGAYHETTNMSGHLDLSLPFGVPFAPYEQGWGMDVRINKTAMALLVEVTWSDPLQDLDATAWRDNCDVTAPACTSEVYMAGEDHYRWNQDGTPGAPDRPSRILLDRGQLTQDGCEVCHWTVAFRTHTLTAQTDVELYATVFYGEDPEGFTAIPD